ncbi:restriction endonuclease subunit S [Vibrio metoecus]|uniref:restriction endonuclease subunit S n=1 Tax=Vibrio metoecus TaxID=1481663 RepID=UPI00300C76D5
MSVEKNVPEIRFKGFSGGWEKDKLGQLYNFQYGEFNNNPSNGGQYPVYGANGIIGGYTRFNAKSSAVIGHMGEYAGSVLWAEGEHFVTYNGTIAKPKKSDFNPLFGYFSLVKMDLKKICGGSGQPFLSYDSLERLDLVFPVESEQTAIGNTFQKLDNLINQHQQKHDKLCSIKKSMLEKMFPKQGEIIPEIRFKGFSGEWADATLSDVIDVRSGKDYKHLGKGNIPVYGTGGYMLSVDSALSNDEDAIGIGRKGTIDKPYLLRAPFWTVDTLFYAVPKPKFKLDYLYCLFQKIDWKKYDESTGVPSLSKIAINNIPVRVTNEEEQTTIGNYFQKLDALINQHQQQIIKLNNIKQACLSKMFV